MPTLLMVQKPNFFGKKVGIELAQSPFKKLFEGFSDPEDRVKLIKNMKVNVQTVSSDCCLKPPRYSTSVMYLLDIVSDRIKKKYLWYQN